MLDKEIFEYIGTKTIKCVFIDKYENNRFVQLLSRRDNLLSVICNIL